MLQTKHYVQVVHLPIYYQQINYIVIQIYLIVPIIQNIFVILVIVLIIKM